MHTGTHIDAPLHMVVDGDTFESVPLESLVGQAKLFDLTDVEDGISKEDLEKFEIEKGDFILLKTKNSFEENLILILFILRKMGQSILLK